MTQTNDDNQVLDAEARRKRIQGFCVEMSASMHRAEGEREYQKEAVKKMAEDTAIEKKDLRKMARTYHKQNFLESHEDQERFEELYRQTFGDETDEDNTQD